MKRKLTTILFLAIGTFLFFLPKLVFAEEISYFQQKIAIKENSTFIVEETIIYDFGESAVGRHGIYRYIPYKYPNTKRTIEIKFLGAEDEKGEKYNYKTGREGDNVYIKIGDANINVKGIKTYKIKYRVSGAINYFQDYDELYWNVTGNGWEVPIKKAKASIIFPVKIAKGDLKLTCYTGQYGSKESECVANTFSEKEVNFVSKRILYAREGLTIVAGWPKGITKEPTAFQKFVNFLSYNFLIFLPLIIFPWFFVLWQRRGKDPQGRGTIIAEYEPPEGILPSEAGAVLEEKIGNKGITATIIDLARRGCFKIKEIENKRLGVFKSKNWELVRSESFDSSSIQDFENNLIEALFLGSKTVSLSKLKERTTLPQKIEEFKDIVFKSVVNKGYFPENPRSVILKSILKGELFIGVFTFLMFFSSRVSLLNILSVIISTIIVIFFGRAMPRRTKEGKEVQEKLLGFKDFLSVTEKDRVRFHFSPEAHPEKFAEYLSFAIMFGVEKEWAKLFEGIELPKPDWYEGSWARGYSAFALADSISDFNSRMDSSISSASAASAAASGSSGFGGGGFSGGGFGGGGGGSW